ncbi:DUF1062 domain-containing protein [Roseibium sp.]|uniref:DUF1062 domain-containing protein n=1 Tax=Roseibium sp. TaxID=1936156 RepID=UPI003D0FBE61
MSSLLKFEWTILSDVVPAIHRPCGRCGVVRAFVSSGKFRLNANGSRLDAWLIYHCGACNKSWNRTLFERRPVKYLVEGELEALQSNDPAMADGFARKGCRSTQAEPGRSQTGTEAGFHLKMRMSGQDGEQTGETLLVIRNPDRCRARLDQIVAKGLGLSRRKVLLLCEAGELFISDASRKPLRRPAPRELTIVIRDKGDAMLVNRLIEKAGAK